MTGEDVRREIALLEWDVAHMTNEQVRMVKARRLAQLKGELEKIGGGGSHVIR